MRWGRIGNKKKNLHSPTCFNYVPKWIAEQQNKNAMMREKEFNKLNNIEKRINSQLEDDIDNNE